MKVAEEVLRRWKEEGEVLLHWEEARSVEEGGPTMEGPALSQLLLGLVLVPLSLTLALAKARGSILYLVASSRPTGPLALLS